MLAKLDASSSFVINANRLQTWCITLLSYNLAKSLGFLVFSYLEEAYISPSCFVTDIEVFGEFWVEEDNFVSFHLLLL